MPDKENLFDFGTGSIKKDQWLRDIDNEQDAFISRYGNATNKHRTALLREAFADLRGRIASGDMLNRTADGSYQFGSALKREDKHMQEAYQRALGFMGDIARRQIQDIPAEPEKKAVGNLEERYIRSLNPSGKFNTDAYWNNLSDDERRESLKGFLNDELKNINNYNDFGNFNDIENYKNRLSRVLNLLESKTANDWSLQQLGFTRNWLTRPTEELPETKSEYELVQEELAAQLEAEKVRQGRQLVTFGNNRGTLEFALTTPTYDFNQALNYAISQDEGKIKVASQFNPGFAERARRQAALDYVRQQQQELDNYFSTFSVGWRGIYDIGEDNRNRMANYLARLFSTYNKGTNLDGTPNNDYAFNWSKYFTKIGNNQFLINGSLNKETGRYQYYVPGDSSNGGGIFETNVLDTLNPYIMQQLGLQVPSLKKGGKIEYLLNGGGFDYDAWSLATTPQSKKSTSSSPKPTLAPKSDDPLLDTGDWLTIIGTTAADIGSMLSANAPGWGTIASAGLGVTSTLGNTINEFRHKNFGGGFVNLGIGLGTDLIGLVPGLGTGAKGYKIGRTLTRFARPLMAAFAANNYKEAGMVLNKGLRNGFGSLSAEDWSLLATTLTSMATRGKSAHTRQNNVEFMHRATQHSSPKDTKDNITKHIINEEGFLKAREELLNLKRFGFNTSSNKYTQRIWSAIPEGGEINAPYQVKPFNWKFNFKDKKAKLLELMQEFIKKRNERPGVSEQGNGPEMPIVYPNENVETNGKTFYPLIKNGAKLKALRNGGIIKAQWGNNTKLWFSEYEQPEIQVPLDPNALTRLNTRQTYNFGNDTPTFYDYSKSVATGGADNRPNSKSLKLSQGLYSVPAPGGGMLQNYKSAMDAQMNYYTFDNGELIMGDVIQNYTGWKEKNPQGDYKSFINDYNKNVETLRARHKLKWKYDKDGNPVPTVNTKGWTDYNTLHYEMYPSYGFYYDKNGEPLQDYDDDYKDILGESTWRRLPNSFNGDEMDELRRGFLKDGDTTSYVHMKDDGTLELQDVEIVDGKVKVKAQPEVLDGAEKAKKVIKAVDEEIGNKPEFETLFKDPYDPTLGIIAGKTIAGIMGNRNIYKNLLEEMPQAALRDPINRQLAIVGWQEAIKKGLNQLADLRRILQKQQGSNQESNFATALETERVGRDITDKSFMEDSGRLFETTQKLWNLKNEDTIYNLGVGDYNRRAIADRARMMAQIRAAWRSGDHNILMGALSDTGNWLMKRYQREQDLVDKTKELLLGNLERFADLKLKNHPTYKQLLAKKQAGTLTETDRAKMLDIQMTMMNELSNDYAEKYYSMYSNPYFGRGFKEVLSKKNGGSLEKEKLKARGKDNDRYVSMIKDLRKSSRRRRRRFYYDD